MDVIKTLAGELQIREGQVQAAVKLIDEGNTIPFIARYRKEATGSGRRKPWWLWRISICHTAPREEREPA